MDLFVHPVMGFQVLSVHSIFVVFIAFMFISYNMIRYLRGINNLKNSLITKDAESVDKSRDSQLDCIRAVQVVFLSRLNPDSGKRPIKRLV